MHTLHTIVYTNQFRPPGDAVRLTGINHQVGFSSFKKRIPTPPVPILHLVRFIQVLHRLLCDVDSSINNNNNNDDNKNTGKKSFHEMM